MRPFLERARGVGRQLARESQHRRFAFDGESGRQRIAVRGRAIEPDPRTDPPHRGGREPPPSAQELRQRRVIDAQVARERPQRIPRVAGASPRELPAQPREEIAVVLGARRVRGRRSSGHARRVIGGRSCATRGAVRRGETGARGRPARPTAVSRAPARARGRSSRRPRPARTVCRRPEPRASARPLDRCAGTSRSPRRGSAAAWRGCGSPRA